MDEPSSVAPAAADAGEPLVNGVSVPPEGSGYRRIFSVKHRDLAQTVPWLVSGAEDLDRYGAGVDARTRALASSLWPGALTLIHARRALGPALHAGSRRDGRAARLGLAGGPPRSCAPAAAPWPSPAPTPTATPPRRRSTRWSPAWLEGVDVAIDAGATACRDASTIVSFPSGELKIIRQGALGARAIRQALGGRPDAGPTARQA